MSNDIEKRSFNISENDIVQATKGAIGPDAIVENYDAVLIEEPGVGLLGVHFLIAVRGRKSPGLPIVDVRMFAKMLPPIEGATHHIEAFPMEGSFFKTLQEPLNSVFKSPDGTDGPKWSPKCYLAKEDLIVFEDLSCEGYKGIATPELSIDYMRLAVRGLARFHAAGLLLAEKQGRYAATDLCPRLKLNLVYSNDYKYAGVGFRNASADALAAVLPLMLTAAEKPRLKELQEKLQDLSRGMWDDLEKAKIGSLVPQHGDCHADNFMFKFDEKGNPVDAILIDFQLARFNVPALDLTFLLNLATNPDFVENHSHEIYQFYYENLEKEVARCGHQLEKILTFEEYLASAERVKVTAMYLACMYCTLVHIPKMELAKILLDPFDNRRFLTGCRAAEVTRWFETDPKFRDRVEKMLRKILNL